MLKFADSHDAFRSALKTSAVNVKS